MGAATFPTKLELPGSHQPAQHHPSLRRAEAAQLRGLATSDRPPLVDIRQHHLVLLDRVGVEQADVLARMSRAIERGGEVEPPTRLVPRGSTRPSSVKRATWPRSCVADTSSVAARSDSVLLPTAFSSCSTRRCNRVSGTCVVASYSMMNRTISRSASLVGIATITALSLVAE